MISIPDYESQASQLVKADRETQAILRRAYRQQATNQYCLSM